MFPPGDEGRIPVVAVVGDDSGTMTRHLAVLLALGGVQAGIGREKELVVGQRYWPVPAGTPQERTALLMQNTMVDVALLHTNPGELESAGFGNDRCDVVLLHDTKAIEASSGPGEWVRALKHALNPAGTFVLSADDAVRLEIGLPAAQMVLVAAEADDPHLASHLGAGGRAIALKNGDVVLSQGTTSLTNLGRCPSNEGELTGLLAALAAGLILGQEASTIREYLARMT
jgi:cyanophycin synthetase